MVRSGDSCSGTGQASPAVCYAVGRNSAGSDVDVVRMPKDIITRLTHRYWTPSDSQTEYSFYSVFQRNVYRIVISDIARIGISLVTSKLILNFL